MQLCGDAHLANFGMFATPERRLVFGVNDFDETLPGPWEWDVKRLVASLHVAGRVSGFAEARCSEAVARSVAAYRRRMAELAAMGVLDVWYAQVDVSDLLERIERRRLRARVALTADRPDGGTRPGPWAS